MAHDPRSKDGHHPSETDSADKAATAKEHHSQKAEENSVRGNSSHSDESVTVSAKTLVIGMVVLLAIAGLVWIYQNPSSPPQAPIRSEPAKLDKPGITEDDIVARVDGSPIMRSRIIHQLDQIPLQMKSQVSFAEILNSTINEEILIKEAKARGIDVSQEEAAAYLMMMLNKTGMTRADLESRAKDRNLDEAEVISIFQRRMIINELLKRDVFPTITVTTKEVQDFFDQNKKSLAMPEMVNVKHILLAESDEANATMERLKKGASFETLAKDMSLDRNSAKNGGELGNISRTQKLDPVFITEAFENKPGSIVGPFKTAIGFEIIKIMTHSQARNMTFEEVKPLIESKLKSDKSEAASNAYAAKLREKAKIEWLIKDDAAPR